MAPKFQLYKDAAGKFRFRLRAENNKIVATGEAYEQRTSCLNGIKSVQKNCNAKIEDTTIEGQKFLNPKYEVFKDAAGKFRFSLKASNGEIVAQSEGYETKDGCLDGIEVVKKSCDSEIEDLSINDKPIEDTISHSEINMDKENEILEELKKIRAALEKAPPPQPPKGLWNEFKDFLSKYKILGLAVAFILALYLGILVQALVKDFVIPLLGLAIPGMADLATYSIAVASQVFGVGEFLVALITFVIVAFIAFVVVKVAKRWKID